MGEYRVLVMYNNGVIEEKWIRDIVSVVGTRDVLHRPFLLSNNVQLCLCTDQQSSEAPIVLASFDPVEWRFTSLPDELTPATWIEYCRDIQEKV